MSETEYKPYNFLCVDICRAASEMLQAAGALRAYQMHAPGLIQCPFREIEKAATAAEKAVTNYKRAIAANRKLMTRKEFEAPQ